MEQFKVIADYPNSPFTVGEVIKLEKGAYRFYANDDVMLESDFTQFPHIFHPIPDPKDNYPKNIKKICRDESEC